MADETLSQRLSGHIASLSLEQIPAPIIAAAKLHLLDSIGCVIAGSRLESGKLAYELAAATRGCDPSVTLVGTSLRGSYLDAVQAMATAGHCGELDDIHGGAATCIGAMIVAALLALAEKDGGSGPRLLEAAIAGYETIARVGLSIDAPKLFARGWWPSTVCGAFGVAAAGAKYLEWPVDKTANALGIASLLAGGMLTGGQEGATARHLAFGRAAQNGLQALLATEQGFSGPQFAFEDPRGFCLTLCAEPHWEFLQNYDHYFLPEVAIKPYPCARQLHAGVEALLTILARQKIASSDFALIELAVPTANAAMVNRPSTSLPRAATLGSGQYVMAVTALRGRLDLQSFEEEFLCSAEVRRLMAKVKVVASTELDRHYPKYWSGRVTVRWASGASDLEEIIPPKGETENPMAARDVHEKFIGLAAPVIGERKASLVVEDVSALESRSSVASLLASLKLES